MRYTLGTIVPKNRNGDIVTIYYDFDSDGLPYYHNTKSAKGGYANVDSLLKLIGKSWSDFIPVQKES